MVEKKYLFIGGIRLDKSGYDDTCEFIDECIRKKDIAHIVSINVDVLVKAIKDPELKEIIDNSALALVDSRNILFASYLLRKYLGENVPGSDFLPRFSNVAACRKYKIFFLGATAGVADKTARILIEKNPGLQVVGTYSPPYGFEKNDNENQKIIEIIKEADPDILFVAFGAPKQEKWIAEYKKEYKVPVSMGIGATLDFIAGNVKRAPRWMQSCGIEWLWRLLQEPKRLWKRYLIGNTIFIWIVLKELLKRIFK